MIEKLKNGAIRDGFQVSAKDCIQLFSFSKNILKTFHLLLLDSVGPIWGEKDLDHRR